MTLETDVNMIVIKMTCELRTFDQLRIIVCFPFDDDSKANNLLIALIDSIVKI